MIPENVNAQLAQIEELANQHYLRVEAFYERTAGWHYYRYHDYYMSLLRNQSRERLRKKEIFFVTVNPDTTKCTLQAFVKIIESLVKRTFFKNVVYTFEQRGKTDQTIGDGFHCHIVFDKSVNLSPAQVQRNVYNSVKGIVGNIKHVDVRKYTADFRDEKIEYMEGKKWDADKEDAVKLNSKWRVQENLNNLYIIN